MKTTEQIWDMSNSPRVIYFGAMSGVEHLTSDQVAYSESKLALHRAKGFVPH